MLSTIIDKLKESDPKIEGCSFLIREVSYKDSTKEVDQLSYGLRSYSIRVLFSGKELPTLEKYMNDFIRDFRHAFEKDVEVAKETTGQLVFPSHAGAEYKISVNITIEA
jgi:hypothetical protein